MARRVRSDTDYADRPVDATPNIHPSLARENILRKDACTRDDTSDTFTGRNMRGLASLITSIPAGISACLARTLDLGEWFGGNWIRWPQRQGLYAQCRMKGYTYYQPVILKSF